MKTAFLVCFTLLAGMTARADFSYTSTRKSGPGPGGTTKYFFKGQRMATDSGETTMILDFDAQTMTSINKASKTYTVRNFSDLNQAASQAISDTKIDIKETGQRKKINGYDAKELLMTIEMDSPRAGMKMQMEMSMWLSSDVPGKQELRAFYQRNMERFPWGAMGGQSNPQMQKAMGDLQRKMASMDGVTVLQVIKMKSPGAGGDEQNAQMAQAMAQMKAHLEEMQKQGGPAAAQAQQALARMGGASAGGSGSMFETEMESSDFSTGSIPDSTFAIPAGFQKVDRK
jgi:hypothetical protein